MNKQLRSDMSLTLLGLALLFSGCASVGHNYKYRNSSMLEIGKTKDTDYKALFGKPKSITELKTSDGRYEMVRYIYSHANMGSARVRLLDLEFRDGLLNGYTSLSSFDEDKTVANTDQFQKIQQGVTKKAEVLKLLGKPTGIALCPSQHADFKGRCKSGTEIWVWTVAEKLSTLGSYYGGKQMDFQTVTIVFDKDGVVTETEYSKTKN